MAAVGLKRRVLGLAVLHVEVLRRCWDWRGSHISADWQLVRHIGEAKLEPTQLGFRPRVVR